MLPRRPPDKKYNAGINCPILFPFVACLLTLERGDRFPGAEWNGFSIILLVQERTKCQQKKPAAGIKKAEKTFPPVITAIKSLKGGNIPAWPSVARIIGTTTSRTG